MVSTRMLNILMSLLIFAYFAGAAKVRPSASRDLLSSFMKGKEGHSGLGQGRLRGPRSFHRQRSVQKRPIFNNHLSRKKLSPFKKQQNLERRPLSKTSLLSNRRPSFQKQFTLKKPARRVPHLKTVSLCNALGDGGICPVEHCIPLDADCPCNSDLVDCPSLKTREFAQACYNKCCTAKHRDVHALLRSGNQEACAELPSCSANVLPTPSTETEPTPAPEIEPTSSPKMEPTPSPEMEPTRLPSIESTPSPEMESTRLPSIEPTPSPEMESISTPETESTPSPEMESSPSPEIEPTPMPELAPNFVISFVLPNPTGSDSSNEKIGIANNGDGDGDLTGWQIRDLRNNVVSLSGTVQTGGSVEIRLPGLFLNNDAETVELINPRGTVVNTISYTNAEVGQYICFNPPATLDLVISAALVNPVNGASENEKVMITNNGNVDADLRCWMIKDSANHKRFLEGIVPVGESLDVSLALPPILNNDGDTIKLIAPDGFEIDSRTYTSSGRMNEGPYICFTPPVTLDLVISAALVNPVNGASENEKVMITNNGNVDANLRCWVIMDSANHKRFLEGTVPVGESLEVSLALPPILNNDGDTIKLIAPDGSEIDSQTYTLSNKDVPIVF